jgi:hypothetical protein
VLADYETAPIDEKLRATLHFLATLDPARALAAGVSKQALRDAALVSAMFNMIVRLADAFGWDVPEWDSLMARAGAMLEGGYAIGAMKQRMLPGAPAA